jgi:hypothetical protein
MIVHIGVLGMEKAVTGDWYLIPKVGAGKQGGGGFRPIYMETR